MVLIPDNSKGNLRTGSDDKPLRQQRHTLEMPYSRGKVLFSFGGKCTGRGLGATPYSTASLDRWTKEMCKTEEDVLSAPWSACVTSMLL